MRCVLFILFWIPFLSFAQLIEQQGDECFNEGDYQCAIEEYKKALKTVSTNYARGLEIKIQRSERLLNLRSKADRDYINDNYKSALDKYDEVIKSNPEDEYAKSQIQKINKILYTPSLTLSSDNRSYNKNSRIFEIGFTTDNSTFVSATSEVSWINVFAHQSKKVIEIILEQNKEEFDRVGKILVKATNEHNLVVEKKITITQEGDIEINISQTNFQFEASGGEKQVKIDSKTLDINFIDKPYWIKIEKANTNNDYTIKCERNEMPSSRSGLVSVKIGEQDFILAIGQEGNPKMVEKEFIEVKPKKIKLTSYGSSLFTITSNSTNLKVTSNSDWFTVRKSSGDIYIIKFESNYTGKKRKGKVIIKTEYSTKYVPVHQGKDKTTSKDKYIDVCFNCPKTKDIIGLNIGYTNRQFDDYEGIQLGLKINPLLKYGFGINTGVNLESYWFSISNVFKEEPKPSFYNLNIPLHFEYRLNFSKWFNMYAYAGGGFNYQTTDFRNYFFPTTFEYGAGIRIGKVQTSIGWSEFITNFTKEAYPHDKVRNSKRFSIILSIVF